MCFSTNRAVSSHSSQCGPELFDSLKGAVIALTLGALMPGVLLLAGCTTTYGAGTIDRAQRNYGVVIAQAKNEQLLSNLVRLRYRDTTAFLELRSVVTQYQYRGGAALAGQANIEGDSSVLEPTLDLSYQETPTISYAPLTGSAFAERLLRPISPEAIIALSAQGWSIHRLLLCCVERMNGMTNAPSTTGPTPSRIPANTDFQQLAEWLRRLQRANLINIERDSVKGEERAFLVIEEPPAAAPASVRADVEALRNSLALEEGLRRYRIINVVGEGDRKSIAIRTRSLLGVMFALSHAVDVPEAHYKAGLSIKSRPAPGAASSWSEFLGGYFRVRSSRTRPEGAYVQTRYRGYWFYIPDNDLATKSTFLLFNYLLALQSAGAEGAGILLTIPAGSN